MDTSFEKRIRVAEVESKLDGQELAIKKIKIEMMKYEARIENYKVNIEGIEKEIVISKKELEELKGGE